MIDIGKISVIIPVYKVEGYINKCIESVINQTYENIEIILVDDGSPDNCGRICDDYALMDSRIKVIHKVNGGLSDARNAGIDVATGEYYFFLDSDDYVKKEILEILSSHIHDHKVDIASVLYNSDFQCECLEVLSSVDMIKYIFIEKHCGWEAWGKLIRAELVRDKRFPVGKIYEDLLFIPEVILQADKCSCFECQLYHYTIREDSIMGKSKSVLKTDLIHAVEKCLNLFCNKLDYDSYTDFLKWSIDFLWTKYSSISDNYKNNKEFLAEIKAFFKRHKKLYFEQKTFKNNFKKYIKFCVMRYSALRIIFIL